MTIRVRAIIEKDGKFLFVKQHHDPPFWCLPGGKVDPGESISQAIHRELVEELGVRPIVGRLLYVHQFMRQTEESLEFFFEITNGPEYGHIDLGKTTHGTLELERVSWLNPNKKSVLPEFLRNLTKEMLHDKNMAWPKLVSRLP